MQRYGYVAPPKHINASNEHDIAMFVPQGPRAQIDRTLYKKHMQGMLFSYPNLDVRAGSVFDLVIERSRSDARSWGKIIGVKLGMPSSISILHFLTPFARQWRGNFMLSGRNLHRDLPVRRDSYR